MNRRAVGLAIVAGCVATGTFADAPSAPGNLDSDVAMILDNPLPESQYSETLRCLTMGSYRSVEVLDTGHLLFWGSNGKVWLNQLRPACIGLAKDQILKFQMNGPSLCELDRFQGFDRVGQAGNIVAMCGLQRFEAVSEEQANQLREMLRRRAHSSARVPPPQRQPQSQSAQPESQPEAAPQHE